MNDMRGTSSILVRGLITTAVLAVVAAIVIQWAEHSRIQLPILGEVPYFKVTASSGVDFTRESLNGRVHVFDFIFTRCPGICPVMTASMKKLYDLYHGSDKVRFISITVDPDYDSLEVLQRYAVSHGVTDDRWIFTRTALVDVASLIETGFMLDASGLPSGHPSKLILVDDQGRIRGYYSPDDEVEQDLLRQHIRQLGR